MEWGWFDVVKSEVYTKCLSSLLEGLILGGQGWFDVTKSANLNVLHATGWWKGEWFDEAKSEVTQNILKFSMRRSNSGSGVTWCSQIWSPHKKCQTVLHEKVQYWCVCVWWGGGGWFDVAKSEVHMRRSDSGAIWAFGVAKSEVHMRRSDSGAIWAFGVAKTEVYTKCLDSPSEGLIGGGGGWRGGEKGDLM